jgi:hypothetical protein
MKFDSALSIVVLPLPVAPAMIVETFPATAIGRTVTLRVGSQSGGIF